MEKKHTSSRYSTGNTIINPDHAAGVGIFEHPNSDVNWSNAAQGQGGERGKKPQGEGHKIYKKTIKAYRKSYVGNFNFHNFHNLVVEDICHYNITAENSTKVGLENFGNINYNRKTKDHGKAAGGSSRSQANILTNTITARNGSSYVGMFNFHNVYINGAQGQGGFLKHKGISHNIGDNTIKAVNSRKVGIQDFGNIK